MQQFISNIVEFLKSIFDGVYTKMTSYASYIDKYPQFLNKNVFTENSLIGINLTWQELIMFVGSWLLTILILVLFVKFVLKMLKVITN